MDIENAFEILDKVTDRNCEGCNMEDACDEAGTGLCVAALKVIRDKICSNE